VAVSEPKNARRREPGTRRPYKPAAVRRAEILAAARRVFVKSGYGGTTVRDIAADADVNEAMLYRFFPSKDSLFDAAVAEPLREAVSNAFAPVEGDAGVREVSETFVRDLLEAMEEIAPLLTVVLADSERGVRFYREQFEPELDRLQETIDINLDVWAHREFDAQVAMRAVFGMCLFVALDARFGSRKQPDPSVLVPELFSLFWDGLRRRPEDDPPRHQFNSRR
jgi:AcrR family transcriptional regulator